MSGITKSDASNIADNMRKNGMTTREIMLALFHARQFRAISIVSNEALKTLGTTLDAKTARLSNQLHDIITTIESLRDDLSDTQNGLQTLLIVDKQVKPFVDSKTLDIKKIYGNVDNIDNEQKKEKEKLTALINQIQALYDDESPEKIHALKKLLQETNKTESQTAILKSNLENAANNLNGVKKDVTAASAPHAIAIAAMNNPSQKPQSS